MSIEAKKPRMAETIFVDKEDLEGIQVPHNDALIVLARIANWGGQEGHGGHGC